MASGYNLISGNEKLYPSIFGVTTLPTGASVGNLVRDINDYSKVYIVKNQIQIYTNNIENPSWILTNKPCNFEVSSLKFNDVEYVLSPQIRNILAANVVYAEVTDWTIGGATYNNYTNCRDYWNFLFVKYSLPIKATLYNEFVFFEISENDTLQLTFENSQFGSKLVYDGTTAKSYDYPSNVLSVTANINEYVTRTGSSGLNIGLFNNLTPALGTWSDLELLTPNQGIHIEDGVVQRFDFYLDISKKASVNSMSLDLLAWNNLTNESFKLDNFILNLNNSVISNDIQEFNVDYSRGFNLVAGSQFNYVKIVKGSLIGDLQYYTLYCGLKITWQDWIKVIDADVVFYDNTKPQFNLNKKASNYSEKNYYSVRIALNSNVNGVNPLGVLGTTDYSVVSDILKVYDYDESGDEWSCELKTYDAETDTDLSGKILTDRNTRIVATFDNNSKPLNDNSFYYAIIRLEPTNNFNSRIFEISTFATNDPNAPLIGDSEVQMTLVKPTATTLRCNCIVDYTKLENGTSYNASARISDNSYIFKNTEDYEPKYTEDNIIKTIE